MVRSNVNARKTAISNMLGKNRQIKKPLNPGGPQVTPGPKRPIEREIQPVPGNPPVQGAYQKDFQNRRK